MTTKHNDQEIGRNGTKVHTVHPWSPASEGATLSAGASTETLDPAAPPRSSAKSPIRAPHAAAPADDFPTCMAEALDILVDRAKRHGLLEVAHLLEVAALAARETAKSPPNGSRRPTPERDCFPSSPA